MALGVKNPSANAGNIRDMDLIPGLGRFPGKGNGNPLQYSCLENPMDRGTWQATVHRVTQNQTQLKLLSTHTLQWWKFLLTLRTFTEFPLDPGLLRREHGVWRLCILLKQRASRPTCDILNPSWSVYTENRPP